MPAKTKPNVLVAAGGKEDTMRGACLTVTTGDFFFSAGGAGLAAMSAHPLGAVFFFSFGADEFFLLAFFDLLSSSTLGTLGGDTPNKLDACLEAAAC